MYDYKLWQSRATIINIYNYHKIFENLSPLLDKHYIDDRKKFHQAVLRFRAKGPKGFRGLRNAVIEPSRHWLRSIRGRLRLRLIFLCSSVGSRPVQTAVFLSGVFLYVLWILRREISCENEKVWPSIFVLTQDKSANIAVYSFSC